VGQQAAAVRRADAAVLHSGLPHVSWSALPQARGQYQVKAEPPFVPGNEAAGEVSEIGERVSSLARGDKVIVLRRGGGYASESVADEQLCIKVPSASADLVEAAALLVNYGTAHLALSRRAALQPHETVLVTAAAGS
jgi:NADPH2:quinone reductase